MDFKKIIEKINNIEGIETKKVDLIVDIHGKTEIPDSDKKQIRLDESESIRVLAGMTTIVEAQALSEKKLTKAEKEKKEEVVKSMKKDKAGFKERYGKRGEEVMHATATKIAKKKAESQESDQKSLSEAGLDMNLIKAASEKGMGARKSDPESDRNINKPYGYRSDKAMDDDDDDDDEPKAKKRKAKKESVDPQQFRDKFFALVEAKKREAEKKTAKGKKAEEKMDEGKKSTKKKPDDDGDGVPNWADKKPGEDDHADKKPAGKKGMSAKQAKYFGKKKSVKESIAMEREIDGDEFGDEGPEDLLYAVEREIKNPGSSIDNLVDVLNATFGSDDSPEFEKARRIIEKYIELVTVTDLDHYDDDDDDRSTPAIAAMKHGDIQRHIREYDLTDRLLHASDMLEKVIRQSESADLDEFYYFDGPDSKKKDRGEDELARREKGGHKATDPSYKQKDDPKYGGRYKIGGPKGKLPESQRRYKKVVAESRETKMSFRDMMRLVVESGGQQQIDPLDKELFAWATRVARNKLGEGMKSEVYAGLVYERMGGRFDMYDVLSEDQKKKLKESKINEEEDDCNDPGENYYDSDYFGSPCYKEIDETNPPLDATGWDYYNQTQSRDGMVPFIEKTLGIPHVMYYDDDELVFYEKTVATLDDTIGDMIKKTKKFMEENPMYVRKVMSDAK